MSLNNLNNSITFHFNKVILYNKIIMSTAFKKALKNKKLQEKADKNIDEDSSEQSEDSSDSDD